MFESSVVESRRRKRSSAFWQSFPVAVVAHLIVIGAMGAAALMDLTFPLASPAQIAAYSVVEAPPPPPPPPPPPAARPASTQVTEVVDRPLNLDVAPSMIPDLVPSLPLPVASDDAGVAGGVEGGVEGGEVGGVVGGVLGGVIAPAVAERPDDHRQLIVPLDAKVPLTPTSQVFPEFPELARLQRLEGTVVVRYVVDRRGRVTEVTVVKKSVSKLFDDAALKAVRNWRFRPLAASAAYDQVVHDLTIFFVLEHA